MNVREAVVLSQGEQDASRAATLTLAAETAVANATAGGALPVLRTSIKDKHIKLNAEHICCKTADTYSAV